MIDVKRTQERVKGAGYSPGAIDGIWGSATMTAILAHAARRQPDETLRGLGAAMATELPRHGITEHPSRLAEFLAQTGHETGGFSRFSESMCYSARRIMQVWPKRFPTLASALPYAWDSTDPDREDIALANRVYGGRMGNEVNGTDDNDGWDHRGGGLMQHTGFEEYRALERIGITSEQVHGGDPVAMVRAACDYWTRIGANTRCDRGEFRALRQRINGGTNGLSDVTARRARSLTVIS